MRTALREYAATLLQKTLTKYYTSKQKRSDPDVEEVAEDETKADASSSNPYLAMLNNSPSKKPSIKKQNPGVFVSDSVKDNVASFINMQQMFYSNESIVAKLQKNELTLDDTLRFYKEHIGMGDEGLFGVFCSSNVIASTSANPERLFSICGNLETKRNKGTASALVNNARRFCKSNDGCLSDSRRISLYINCLDKRTDSKKRKFDSVRNICMKPEWKQRISM